jgi:hypothetical protein
MKSQFHFVRRVVLAAVAVAFSFLVCASNVRSESLPSHGTFEGVYHKNAFGLCEFGAGIEGCADWLVDPKLDEQLSKYDGKPIRLEAKTIEQPCNPGPGVIVEIGEIAPLDVSPLAIEVKAPAEVQPNTPFALHFTVTNKGDKPIDARGELALGTSALTRQEVENKGHYNDTGYRYKYFILTTYTQNRQLNNVLNLIESPGFIGAMVRAEKGYEGNLAPGESWSTTCYFKDGLEAGRYEFHIQGAYSGQGDNTTSWPVSNYVMLEATEHAGFSGTKPPEPGCAVKAEYVSANETGTTLRVSVKNTSDAEMNVPVYGDEEQQVFSGIILAYSGGGAAVPLTLDERPAEQCKWTGRVLKPGEKAACKYHVRTTDPFSPLSIAKFVVLIASDGEVVQSELSVERDLSRIPLPGAGNACDGVRMRVRPEKQEYSVGEVMRVYIQLENESGKPRYLRGSERTVTVFVDGKPLDLPKGIPDLNPNMLWQYYSTQKTWYTHVDIPAAQITARPGRHVLRVVYKNGGGLFGWLKGKDKFKDEFGHKWEYVKGKMASNEYKFVVKEKKQE